MAGAGAFARPYPAFTPAQRWHLDVYGFVLVPNTLTKPECAKLRRAVISVRGELLAAPREADEAVRGDARGPGPGGSFIRPANKDSPLHLLAHLIEADPAITAYASHPMLVAMCEEYIGGEARIVESNCFVNRGNPTSEGGSAGQPFAPSWHRGTDLPYASYIGKDSGLVHCNFVKALSNLTELRDAADGGTVLIKGSHKMDVPTAELAAMAATNPEMVHTVVAPAGSTLVFGETTVHATGSAATELNLGHVSALLLFVLHGMHYSCVLPIV
jgi:ectoine hydroxylase-related dioxygenase (phytanoyl-CoA dioxygenase family)